MADFDPWDPSNVEYYMTPYGRRKNPFYKHKKLSQTLSEIIAAQRALKGRVHATGQIHTTLNKPWHNKTPSGHTTHGNHSGQTIDAGRAFVEGILTYSFTHQIQIRHVYEIFVDGLGSFFVVFTDLMSKMLNAFAQAKANHTVAKTAEKDPIVQFIMNLSDSSKHISSSSH